MLALCVPDQLDMKADREGKKTIKGLDSAKWFELLSQASGGPSC